MKIFKSKITILVLIASLIVSIWIIVKYEKEKLAFYKVIEQHEKKDIVEKKIPLEFKSNSRVTFFHTAPIKCSLAIPEGWEGNYWFKEDGKEVNFYYYPNPEDKSKLFSIKYFDNSKPHVNDGKLILEKDDTFFTYNLSTGETISDEYKEEYETMRSHLSKMINSFKCFVLD